MDPQTHFLFPFVIASFLVKLNLISWKFALLCGLIGVLIDLDHYIEQIIYSKSNRFSLKAAWNNAVRFHRFNQRSFIHHWKGALVLTFIFLVTVYFNWKTALILAISYYSHLLLDYIHLKKENELRWKIEKFYIKESYFEVILNIILVIILVIILLV